MFSFYVGPKRDYDEENIYLLFPGSTQKVLLTVMLSLAIFIQIIISAISSGSTLLSQNTETVEFAVDIIVVKPLNCEHTRCALDLFKTKEHSRCAR